MKRAGVEGEFNSFGLKGMRYLFLSLSFTFIKVLKIATRVETKTAIECFTLLFIIFALFFKYLFDILNMFIEFLE